MAEVKLVNVKKIYPFVSGEEKKSKKKKKGEEPAEEKKVNLQITDKGVVAVQEFNLDIADKEFIVLVGPSGCGKSTTLRMVAGLEEISEGELYIDGKLMNDVAPKDRDIAMVFQNYALYPHMTVYDNMAFSLKLKKTPKAEIDRKVREAAEILDITQYLNRKPKALSGGQRQRVAIGRAIVRNPKVFLMDEPLSNLDAKLRNQMRAEIIKLREKIDTTFIYVTHDQVEAMTLGDRIVIMRDGFIQQIGTPQEVFNHPANLFVAGFIGTPQMNFFDATLSKKGDKVQQIGTPEDIYNESKNAFVADFIGDSNIVDGVMHRDFLVSFSGVEFPCVDRGFAREESVQVVVRPEDIEVVSPVEGQLVGVVNDVIFKGVHFEMHVECEGREWLIHSTRACTPGETIGMRIGPNEIHIMSRSEG